MDFKYTKAISKIRKMDSRIKVIQGGSSAGKTIAILSILIDKALRQDNLSISVVSESTPHLRRGAIRDFINIMKATKRFQREQWHVTNSTYRFLNGSYIEFFSADQGDKLRGARRDILYINEANNISRDAYLEMSMRTNQDIFIDYNPSHSFWNKEVLRDDNASLLILTYKDNSGLPQTVIEFLESKRDLAKTSDYWSNWVKVYLDGLEGKLQGTIFDSYEEIDIIPKEARLLGCGLDFGFSSDPSAMVAIYKYNDQIICDEIFYRKGLHNNELANLIKSHNMDRVNTYADSAEPKTISELRRYGIKVSPVTKGRDSIMFGISILQEQNLVVTKRSKNLLNELETYQWKEDKEGNPTNTPIGGNDHALDSLRYAAMMLLKKKTTEGAMPFMVRRDGR